MDPNHIRCSIGLHHNACSNTFSGGSRWGSCPPPPQIKTRARSRWGTIANPHAKVFDSPLPQLPQVPPWQQNENPLQYVFYLLFVRTHTKFGIKSLKMTY